MTLIEIAPICEEPEFIAFMWYLVITILFEPSNCHITTGAPTKPPFVRAPKPMPASL